MQRHKYTIRLSALLAGRWIITCHSNWPKSYVLQKP